MKSETAKIETPAIAYSRQEHDLTTPGGPGNRKGEKMKRQTLKEWFNEHTECKFEKIDCVQAHGDEKVLKEYSDGTYQLCKTDGGFVFLSNGTESVIYPIEDLSGFGEFYEKEVKERLSIK